MDRTPLRYQVVKWLYPLLRVIMDLYFLILNFVFRVISTFSKKNAVPQVNDKLLFVSAKRAAEKIRRKEVSSKELVKAYISRIKEINPIVNAVVQDNFNAAMEEAEAVDLYIRNQDANSEEFNMLHKTKPLLGVPFSCKDNLMVKGFVTVAGNRNYTKNPPNERDAEVVRRLRESGAILIAITNLPKMAMNWNSVNEVYGQTSNPYDTRRLPGGSSGGEGALVSSAGSLFGPGNDLAGSIRLPASMCGVYGIKPTKGLVSLDGFVPPITYKNAIEQWSIGPLCRYAEDLPLILNAMVGEKLGEHDINPFLEVDFRQIKIFTMEDLKIFFVETIHPEMREAVRKTKRYFEDHFGTLVQSVDFPLAHHMFEIWGALGYSERTATIGEIVSEIRNYTKDDSEATIMSIIFNVLMLFVKPRDEAERTMMENKREKLRNQFINLLNQDGILVFPALSTPAPFHHQHHFTPFNIAYTQLFNILGLPAVVCPVGLNKDGIPTSVQLVGGPYSEGLLMAACQELEKGGVTGWVQPGAV